MKSVSIALCFWVMLTPPSLALAATFQEVWNEIYKNSPVEKAMTAQTEATQKSGVRAENHWLPRLYLDTRDGVEYVYSTSQAHGALVTIRFKVGEPMEPSLVKVHHKLMTLAQDLPKNTLPPQVRSFSIDDVPFLVLTFSSETLSPYELRTAIAPLARELSSTPDLSKTELLGGQRRVIRVVADPQKMQSLGVSLLDLYQSLQSNDFMAPSGKNWSERQVLDVEVGGRIQKADDVGHLAIGQRGGRVVYMSEVAQITDGPEELVRVSSLVNRSGAVKNAVSIVLSKRKGTNVVPLANDLLAQANSYLKENASHPQFQKIKMSVVRDYGLTAEDKSNELIEHLLLATLSVSVLIALFMGIRASVVVAIAIPVTLALTLAIYYFMGYTLNRVTLFALIFSIGILVDDAIVVVENIERHLKENLKGGLVNATLRAVSEVGNPTILATFTVIAAILPMAFVRGLMGPYMKPIPVGASFAMLLSLLVAFVVTPWASVKLLKAHSSEGTHPAKVSRLDQMYQKVMDGFLKKRFNSIGFLIFTLVLFFASASLVYFKVVKVKMLPFDNKQEFQVIVDYPPATPLVRSKELTENLAQSLLKNKDVQTVQTFVGEAAPFSFSGMVKHTFLRGADYQADLHVVLSDKSERKESSHEIIESLRPAIHEFSLKHQALTKVLEIPPGPPVLATMLAEVYGPDDKTRASVTQEIAQIFASEPSVVDLDTTLRPGRMRRVYEYNPRLGGQLGANAKTLSLLGSLVFSETGVTSLANVEAPEEVPIMLSLAQKSRSGTTPFIGLRVPSLESGTIEIEKIMTTPKDIENVSLYRKNLKPVSYVMSELSGSEEAPVYGIMKLAPKIKYPLQTAEVPSNTSQPIIKWDGEWFITYEVFRDLGGAFAVVMLLIYILVLGWFKSFTVPLIIMAPIPISLIGILPGHALVGSYFTATSMIGFIAGAGIIVRNSIILVDFIEHQLAQGMALKKAVISAGVLRFRPMLLTAAAVVVGPTRQKVIQEESLNTHAL